MNGELIETKMLCLTHFNGHIDQDYVATYCTDDDDDDEEDDKITLLNIPKITGWEQVSEWVRRLRAACEDSPPHRSS